MVATTPAAQREPWHARLELPIVIPGALLAALMLWSVARSLIDANWAAGLEIIMGLVLPALLVGIVFARIGWMPGWLAHPLAAALGIAWSFERVGPTLIAQVSEAYGAGLAARLDTWGERATEIMLRALVWLRILQAGGRGEDIVLFVVTVALMMWALGYLTGWLIFRAGRTWLAVVLSAMIILINYTFTYPKPTQLFFVFLSSALLLMVYQNVAQQQRLWRAALIEFPSLMLWRAVIAAGLFCLGLVVVTGLIPGTVTSVEAQRAWRVLKSPFSALRESWQDAFSTINAPPGTSGSFATRGVRVGGPRSLGDAVVMRIRSPEYDYWRAVAFDKYSGLNWQNTVGERARATLGVPTAEQARSFVAPGEPLIQAELRSRELITQTITLAQGRTDGLLMVGGQFASASVPVLIQHGLLLDSESRPLPNFTETSAVVADVPLEETASYSISVYLSAVDERSLRDSGTGYPEWVTGSYLQLPDTLPARVREQARTIVEQSGATTPYDQALALQNYLRTLPYDERRPAPPEDRDWVDYFLFESQRGYCDDFASAMVVMLRSQGIPARWVQGYAGGTLDPETREWIVRESVAHSWTEVYFPGYGWQRFEPTPAPYAIVPARPAVPLNDEEDGSESSGDVSNALSDPEEIMRRMRERDEMLDGGGEGDLAALQRLIEQREAEARQRVVVATASVVGLLAAAALAFVLFLHFQLRGLSPAAYAYARLARLAGWAGIPQEDHATPREYAEEIAQRLPDQRNPIVQIAAAYESERYRPDHRARNSSGEDWPALRRALVRHVFGRAFAERRQKR
jgi:transglutaminase-like putative cysteine protease